MSDRSGTSAAAAAEEAAMPIEAPPCDEVALVRALMAGGAGGGAAEDEAWRAFLPMVARFLRRFFGPAPLRKEDLEDYCQEVFLRFFKRIDELRDPAAVRGFLISICLGFARNERRRMRVRRWLGLSPSGELPEVAVAGADVETREGVNHLYAILERVSAQDRSLFLTRYVEQMEIQDIAVAHGLTFGTAKRKLARVTEVVGAKMRRDPLLASYASAFGLHERKR